MSVFQSDYAKLIDFKLTLNTTGIEIVGKM